MFVFCHDFDKTCKNCIHSAFQWFYMIFFGIFTPWIVKFKPSVTIKILTFMKIHNIIFCSESKDLLNDRHHFWIRETWIFSDLGPSHYFNPIPAKVLWSEFSPRYFGPNSHQGWVKLPSPSYLKSDWKCARSQNLAKR